MLMRAIRDVSVINYNGFIVLIAGIVFALLVLALLPIEFWPVLLVLALVVTGFKIIRPNEAKVLTFFGEYIGTIKRHGLVWTVPLSTSNRVSLRIVNFNTEKLKVNDLKGNPIEVGAVVVWRVSDAAQATFNVDAYTQFVANQSETAIRGIAATYPYDSEHEPSLRGNVETIGAELREHLQAKLAVAGITVEEVRLSHLAYAPEIASSMLKRQQAEAVLLARKFLIENALTIVDDVLTHFVAKGNIDVSNDKKVELINNLLVTLTSDREASPVVNIGS
ncbi:MAG: SPFH domain-containing protein [Pseudomonadota bacterium]